MGQTHPPDYSISPSPHERFRIRSYSCPLQHRATKPPMQEGYPRILQYSLISEKPGLRMGYMYYLSPDASLIAHWVNLGYVEEHAIRNNILQSLIFHSELYPHQARVLCILFQVAGATFEAYAETSAVDRCFELLEGYRHVDSEGGGELIQVSAFSVKGET